MRIYDDQRLLTVDSKTLWIKSVPIKVNILAWKSNWKRFLRDSIFRVESDKLRAKFVLGGISNIRTLTPSLNGSTGWPLYVFTDRWWKHSRTPEYLIKGVGVSQCNGCRSCSDFTEKRNVVAQLEWIKACLESSRTSILINGSPTSEFNVWRGLKQGDHLSPFLFIIIMEGLHAALSDSVRNGLIRIFQIFHLASGLKINIHKSNIYGIGVSEEDVHRMASNTGCSAGSFPFTYLGLSIGSNMSLTANWKTLVDKFYSKLSSWKSNLLSYGGHFTLIKAVLGSLGIYYLSLFKVPEAILKTLEKSRASFFWGSSQVIRALHDSEGGFDHNGCKFKGIWSRIVDSSNYLHSSSILPSDSIRFQAGCGSLTRFWKDIWLGNSPLYTRFNRLFRLDQEKNCRIVDRIVDGQWSWNWSCNTLGVCNTAYLNSLLLESSELDIYEATDKCVWSLAHDEAFSAAALRRRIDDHILPSLDIKTTWDKTLPRKVNIFMWRLKLDRLPHRLNLSSRGIEIPEISCPSCSGNVESNQHIFFGCDFAKEVWKIIRRWCEEAFPLFDSNAHWIDWLDSWSAPREKKHRFASYLTGQVLQQSPFYTRLPTYIIIDSMSNAVHLKSLEVDCMGTAPPIEQLQNEKSRRSD
ncbi:RNA-directed DNA polymerase, eukaryota, reverse transcriptase zinc-binding domain protein [Tanacetum coccineum]